MAENTMETTVPTNTSESSVATRESTVSADRWVTPPVDIYETDNLLTVVADMPGLTQEAIDVHIDNDVLTIRGTNKETVERDYVYREFDPVNYFRQFTLGNKIDQSKIEAEYKGGVLTLNLPFAEEAKPRQIDVKVS